jgi:uncharacterized protein YqjF (DUF2071 family)
MLDYLALRHRPPGRPAMQQKWGRLAFLHWPLDPAQLQPLLPAGLELDLYEGRAWIGLVAFTMWGIHPPGLPGIPTATSFHELNVRTYVHHRGVPGVYFFSLDAASRLAVWGARTFWHMPYFNARMDLREKDGRILYTSQRTHAGARPATFYGIWKPGDPLPPSAPGSLAFFLTERYGLYTEHRGRLLWGRIWHQPWPLRTATLEDARVHMLDQLDLPEPEGAPVIHCAHEIATEVWPLRPV